MKRCATGGGVSVQEPINASTEPDESAVEQACERMILEAVRLLQEGQLEQAEYLLEEGALPLAPQPIALPCTTSGLMQLICPHPYESWGASVPATAVSAQRG